MDATRTKVNYKCSCGSSNYITYDQYIGSCIRECISGSILKHDSDDQIGEHIMRYSIKCHDCGKYTTLKGVRSHAEFVEKYGVAE